MYGTGYRETSLCSQKAKKKMQYRSKGKSCGYYMRIVFFFSSLIQSLIIVGLVLFLVYGKNQDSASADRIQDLEETFSRLSIENMALKQQRKNLTNLLNVTLTEKARNDFDLVKLRHHVNLSIQYLQNCSMDLHKTQSDLRFCILNKGPVPYQPTVIQAGDSRCGLLVEQIKARLQLVDSNFTHTVKTMKMDKEQIAKDRDSLTLEAIHLRREKSTLDKEVQSYREKYTDEFIEALTSLSNVSKAFLQKIDMLFPAYPRFWLTCAKQREHLEEIRTNCTNLSREVEDKLQQYMNTVGKQVSDIHSENKRLKAENWRLLEDYRWCSQNRTGLIQQHRQNLDKLQQKHDNEKEGVIREKIKLDGDIQLMKSTVNYKSKEIDHLTEQLKQLNKTCAPKTAFGFSGGFPSRTSTQSQPGFGLGGGSSSSGVNQYSKLGSSYSPSGSSYSSSGSTLNKVSSTGELAGRSSSSSSSLSLGSSPSQSSTGAGINKPSLTEGALGSALNQNPVFSGRDSSGTGSSSGSTSRSTGLTPNLSSANKPTSNVKSSQSLGSRPSSGSTTKTASSSLPWFSGWGSSQQSKTGSVPGKGTTSGTSSGSPISGGKTTGLTNNPGSVFQHIQELQRLINPPGPEEKKDLSRILG
ncbi:uncharacterized protein KZ484_020321 isoform 2-T2 [Pholidichthys leucotaenia]